jgi:hypothetical protein
LLSCRSGIAAVRSGSAIVSGSSRLEDASVVEVEEGPVEGRRRRSGPCRPVVQRFVGEVSQRVTPILHAPLGAVGLDVGRKSSRPDVQTSATFCIRNRMPNSISH